VSKHKKKAKKVVSSPEPLLTEPTQVVSFGYEEMLSELEALFQKPRCGFRMKKAPPERSPSEIAKRPSRLRCMGVFA
jgi:hypothetical protein